MQELLKEILASPGVLGSCVYTNERGIMASNLPSIFKPETQQRIGNILHRIFKLNETVKLDVNSFEVQYDEALILVKKLCGSASLVTICEPDVNIHLTNMTISMLTSDLMNSIADCEHDPASPVSQPEQPSPPPPPADPASVINGAMSQEFSQIKKALAKCIGPVAGMTLESSVKKWLETGEPSTKRLNELAHSMLPEIDDEASRAEFLADLQNLL